MTQRISTLEIRKHLGDLLNRVALKNDQFVIERRGKPLAAMVSVAKFEQIEALARRFLLGSLRDTRRAPLVQGDADEFADEAKHRSRRRHTRQSKAR